MVPGLFNRCIPIVGRQTGNLSPLARDTQTWPEKHPDLRERRSKPAKQIRNEQERIAIAHPENQRRELLKNRFNE